ncbi:hypothetical protein [Alicyclobacillus cycloheptanicus]|uniref:Uncharacterized protein n=1 Tax=Alicyclobacillus cycloheptanicus TaxID=1457 RepID=A0ABT9XPE2_9BACL|nr:hypothetical protein [Alicyclobacillus cycloheptanicus]MDQ0191628.1 hypothetical protein [Alicyclobacillus cycloheptanicus]
MKRMGLVLAISMGVCMTGGSALAATTTSGGSPHASGKNLVAASQAQLEQTIHDVQTGNYTPTSGSAKELTNSGAQPSAIIAPNGGDIYGPYTFDQVGNGNGGLSSAHFSLPSGDSNIEIDSSAYESYHANSGKYYYTVYEDFWYGATDEGTKACSYGENSAVEGAQTWTGLSSGSYNFVVYCDTGYVTGHGTVYGY